VRRQVGPECQGDLTLDLTDEQSVGATKRVASRHPNGRRRAAVATFRVDSPLQGEVALTPGLALTSVRWVSGSKMSGSKIE